MRDTTNIIEYDQNTKLKCSVENQKKSKENNVNLYILDISDNSEKITKEIKFIVEKIQNLILDKNYKLSDFCIMIRNYNKHKDIVLNVLNQNGINIKLDDFFESEEIKKLILILKFVNNQENDIFFIHLMLNNAFNFNVSEIVKIKKIKNTESIYDSLNAYLKEYDDDLSQKCKIIVDFVDDLNSNYKLLNLYEFILFTIDKIKNILLEIYDDRKFQLFLDLTNDFIKLSEKHDIQTLLNYIERRKCEENSSNFENNDALLVSSIHKTKGKEFRACFLMGCSDNFKKNTSGIIFDSDLGFSFKLNKKSNLEYSCMQFSSDQKKIEEEMRILYVSLTRAKEKLYVILSSNDAEKDLEIASAQANAFEEIHPYFITSAKNFAEWLLMISCKSKKFKFKVINMKNSPQIEGNGTQI